jgi:hypothetical protein
MNLSQFLDRLPAGTLTRKHLLCDETLLAKDGKLSVYFIPFGDFSKSAKIALVGITPGFEQMRLAYAAARDYSGPERNLYRICGAAAGFGGPMRKLLIEMLVGIGIPQAMGLTNSAELFDPNRRDVIRPSVLNHPVFVNGENYTGHSPVLVKSEFLMRQVRKYFHRSITRTPNALLVPMGMAVESVFRKMQLPNPVLWGFPHPSPANGHRSKQFATNQPSLIQAVNQWHKMLR